MASRLALALFFAVSAPRVCVAGEAGTGAPPNTAPDPANATAQNAGALAQQRYREGDAAMNRSDFEGARLAFVQAYALDPSPQYLWNLAIAEAKGAHPIEALGHLRQYLRLPSVTETERSAAAVWMADAASKTGHIRVETSPGATITLDSTFNAGTTPLAEPLDVPPGPHRLTATRGAQTASTSVEPHAGETVVWQLQWESVPAAGPGAPSSAEASAASHPQTGTAELPRTLTPNGKPLPTTKWIVAASLVGAGLVTFGVAGGVTAAGSNEASKEAQLSAQTGVCLQPPVTAACAALKSAADARATYGNFALGLASAGGALVVAGVLALVIWPTAKPRTTGFVAPIVASGGGGAQWIQSF